MQIGQAVSQWYDVYLESEYGNDIQAQRKESTLYTLTRQADRDRETERGKT